VQAIVIFALTVTKNTNFPLRQYYVSWPKLDTEPFTYSSISGGIINAKYLIVAFFLLSAGFQCIPYFFKNVYYRLEATAIQPYRWFEYMVSASCLILVCALTNGINDVYFLILLFFANATVMLLGYVQECYAHLQIVSEYIENDEKIFYSQTKSAIKFMLPHLVGWLLYIPIWIILFAKFGVAVSHSSRQPPAWVYAVYIGNFFLFSSFGFVQLYEMMCIQRNPEKRAFYAVRAELQYILLSLFAKTFTAWIFYGGMIASSTFAKNIAL
jgi:hypothetical protein